MKNTVIFTRRVILFLITVVFTANVFSSPMETGKLSTADNALSGGDKRDQALNSDEFKHTKDSTNWDKKSAERYDVFGHGPDGARFMDLHLRTFLEKYCQGEVVADIGCGAGAWSIIAAESGASTVRAIDSSADMIKKAKGNVAARTTKFNPNCQEDNNLQRSDIVIEMGDALDLRTFQDNSVGFTLSSLVGCNIKELKDHINEMVRITGEGKSILLGVPACFEVIFTNGALENKEEIVGQVNEQLSQIPANQITPEKIRAILISLDVFDQITRATFAQFEGHFRLVQSEEQLMEINPEDEIYRKIPGLVVPNYYHPVEEYLQYIRQNIAVDKSSIVVMEDRFKTEQALGDYNQKVKPELVLGEEYTEKNPFAVIFFRLM